MHLLELPFFYNSLRSIIAGDQANTKSFVRSHLSQGSCASIIDIGCGTGDFFDPTLSVPYTGIDVNSRYISYAQRNYRCYSDATFVCDDILTSPLLSSNHYDAVLFISMMHHLNNSDCERMFRRITALQPRIILIADIIPHPPRFLQQLMVRLDRGNYVRPPEEKLTIIERFFSVTHTEFIQSRLAIQHGIVCTPRTH